MDTSNELLELQQTLEKEFLALYGPLLTGDDLRKALGYISKDAFRQSMVRRTVPVPLFEIEHHRGKYALTKEVAHYIAKRRLTPIKIYRD